MGAWLLVEQQQTCRAPTHLNLPSFPLRGWSVKMMNQPSAMGRALGACKGGEGSGRARDIMAALRLPFLQERPAPSPEQPSSPSREMDRSEPHSERINRNELGPSTSSKPEQDLLTKPSSSSSAAAVANGGKRGLPQSLTQRFNLGSKVRGRRPRALDEIAAARARKAGPAPFDYAQARAAMTKQSKARGGLPRGEGAPPPALSRPHDAFAIQDTVRPAKRRRAPATGNRSLTFR